MATKNTYRILIWVIVILAATTISMGVSFGYHKLQDKKAAEKIDESAVEMPAQQRTRFFREQLNLQQDQMNVFRDLNRDYNRKAQQITMTLEALRVKMVKELGKQKPDKNELNLISEEIGKLHTELKNVTIDYYLEMKEDCNEQQQKKLNDVFMSALKTKEDVTLPQRGNRFRGNHNY